MNPRKRFGHVEEVGIRRLVAAASAALVLCFASIPAVAQTSAQTHALRVDPAVDVTVTVAGAAAFITSEILKGDLAPSRCRWCSVDRVDARVREALIWRSPAMADTISSVTAYVFVPLATIGLNAVAAAHDGAASNVPEDALLVSEASVIAGDVDQLTKMLLGRERPFVHALPPDQKPLTSLPSDNNLSFFSGHTTETFALAAASGTIGTMRGYRWAPLAWGTGGAFAAMTAYLRIAADKHWLTDVLMGIVVGAGIGFAVPYLFHSAVDGPPPASSSSALHAPVVPTGTAITLAW
jgi:membrane-associated phospholipid phosphatase